MSDVNLSLVIQSLQAMTQAVNSLNTTVKTVFPQGGTIATSAGSASGKFLTVTGTDGNAYKITLLNP